MRWKLGLIGLSGLLVAYSLQPRPSVQSVVQSLTPLPVAASVKPSPQSVVQRKVQSTTQPKPGLYGIPNLTPKISWQIARALIRTIYYAEGTLYAPRPYNTQFTFAEFEGFNHHPEILRCADGGSLCSDASGAGQWLSPTWKSVVQRCGYLILKDKPEFSPENQDLMMMCHLAEIGAWGTLMNGVAVSGGKAKVNFQNFEQMAYKLCWVWASWPKNSYDTTGCYRQGAKSLNRLWNFFQQELEAEQGK